MTRTFGMLRSCSADTMVPGGKSGSARPCGSVMTNVSLVAPNMKEKKRCRWSPVHFRKQLAQIGIGSPPPLGNALSTVLVFLPAAGTQERIHSPSGEIVGEFTASSVVNFRIRPEARSSEY